MKLLDLLASYENKFDLILLSEIWSTNIIYFDHIFSDYNLIYCVPASQKAGGVAVLVRSSINFKIIDSSQEFNIFGSHAEYIVLDAITNRNSIRFYLFYRHPSTPKSSFLDLFFNFLKIHKPLKKV